MPGLLLLLFVLFAYSLTSGSFMDGVRFMFTPDFNALNWDGVLTAMGLACFTLSIGMGAIMAYGAYLPQETSVVAAKITPMIARSPKSNDPNGSISMIAAMADD